MTIKALSRALGALGMIAGRGLAEAKEECHPLSDADFDTALMSHQYSPNSPETFRALMGRSAPFIPPNGNAYDAYAGQQNGDNALLERLFRSNETVQWYNLRERYGKCRVDY